MAYTTLILFLLLPPVSIVLIRTLAGLSKSKLEDFPPGPPTIPIIGNLHQIPLTQPFLQFAEWGRKYGSQGMIGLYFGSKTKVVVLNNWKSVRDLLDQRGAIYSSRPYIPIVEYVVPPPGDIHLVFMPYGAKWRRARKTMTEFLKDDEVDKLLPIQDAESSQMMHELLESPSCYHNHVLRYFGAVILASAFGTRGKEYSNGSDIKEFFATQFEWAAMLAQGAVPPFDIFPFLKYVPDFLTPWRGWKERAASLKRRQNGLYHHLFEETKARVESGKSLDCFVAGVLRDREKDGYKDIELEYIVGFLMEGGADTTAGAFETFILAMAANPVIQKKAQDEIDTVFGEGGVKLHEVKVQSLPFLKACILETLRWRPGFPMSIPHATTQDDVYQGYKIPANTTILMNTWAIHHDPDEYEDPDVFNPERFLHNPFGVKPDRYSPDQSRRPSYGFGAGRRLCAGQRMAENSLMMTMSKLLWAFDVVAEGQVDTDVHTAFKDAILTGPKKFNVSFKIRSERRREVVEKEWETADAFLKRFE